MTLSIHSAPACDIRIPGAGWFHPFDGRKFSRALQMAQTTHPTDVASRLRMITGPLGEAELRLVHTADYLASLQQSRTIARILEVGALNWIPASLLHRWILHPMLMACAGTRDAAISALKSGGTAVCLGGGFHHAHADHGEGFCVFADIPIAIRALIANGSLSAHDEVLVIDLDAHRGNGFESICHDWPVHFFDLYNFQAYPGLYDAEPERFPFLIPMRSGEDDRGYLATLGSELPNFLDAHPRAKLVFFNAGTDVVAGDPLGRLALTEDGVFKRDALVFAELRRRKLPTVMVTSGGYTSASHRLIARTLIHLITEESAASFDRTT